MRSYRTAAGPTIVALIDSVRAISRLHPTIHEVISNEWIHCAEVLISNELIQTKPNQTKQNTTRHDTLR